MQGANFNHPIRAKAEERAPERPREMAQEVGNIELEKALEELLADASFDCVRWVKQTTSTQDLACSLVRMSEAPVTAVHVADEQSAGRGTHGRRWRGAQGTLMLTITAPLAVPLEECSGLAPAVGIAAARALRSVNSGVGVKWPNDLWLAGGKLAGILCETCRDKAGGLHVAAGIGVNIALDSELPGFGAVFSGCGFLIGFRTGREAALACRTSGKDGCGRHQRIFADAACGAFFALACVRRFCRTPGAGLCRRGRHADRSCGGR